MSNQHRHDGNNKDGRLKWEQINGFSRHYNIRLAGASRGWTGNWWFNVKINTKTSEKLGKAVNKLICN